MKKNYKLIILLLAVSPAFTIFSQIQLSPGDIVHGGSFNRTIDTTGNLNAGSSGANQVWDFRSLADQSPFSYQVLGYNGYGNGNDANLIKVNGTDTYTYFLQTNSTIYNITPLQDFDKVSYQKLRIFNCPLQYQAANGDSFETITYYPGYKMGMPTVDSVRLTFKMANTSVADGWGVLKMSSQDYNVLRIMTIDRIEVRMAGKKGTKPYADIPGYSDDEVVVAYSWYAKDQGTYVASYTPADGQVEYMLSSTLSVHDQVAATNSIVFSNPCIDQLHITNNSSDHFRLTLFDMQGKLVSSWDAMGNSIDEVDIAALPAGFYTLQMVNARTQVISCAKVVKQ